MSTRANRALTTGREDEWAMTTERVEDEEDAYNCTQMSQEEQSRWGRGEEGGRTCAERTTRITRALGHYRR